jgi:outer membrane receptor for ferric coprogen and ferric-rhodotorulic acid
MDGLRSDELDRVFPFHVAVGPDLRVRRLGRSLGKVMPELRVGADLNYRSGVYLRGDEINVLGKTSAYTVVNLRAEYRVDDTLRVMSSLGLVEPMPPR